jgi:D-galactarolactone cycloisomerase
MILAMGKGSPARIRSIGVAGLGDGAPKGGWGVGHELDYMVHTLVAVHTEDGVTGVGSTATDAGLVRAAVQVLAPLCIGESALEPERVAEKMHQSTFWLGRGGSLTHVISAIDIAMWDILGQVTGQPVGRLLGGRYRERVRPYASLLAESVDLIRERIVQLRAAGFRAFKIGWGAIGRPDARGDEALVSAAREAAGEDAQLMVDAGACDAFWRHGFKWALRTATMLASYDVHWFEEPLPPDAFHDYVALRAQAPVNIAGGEVLTRRQSYEPWLSGAAFDIVQPDVTKVGGLSEARRIGWMAEARNVQLIPHGWNTALGLAADLQLASALPRTDLVEYLVGSPYIDGIMQQAPRLDESGMLAISDRPGLGIALDRDALAQYVDTRQLTPDGALVHTNGQDN